MTNLALWIGLFVSVVTVELTGRYAIAITPQKFLYPPPEQVEYFTFGFRESLADSFWLRWIQDSDVCQTYLKPVEYLDQDKNGFENRLSPRHKNCDNSWAFKMLDAVTKLAPKFKMPYEAGAISLSVLTEDYVGASEIFDRGLVAYPDDWRIAYRAAYHQLFDLQNVQRAGELILQASQHGGPEWLPLLAARLVSESGRKQMGIAILESYKAGLKDEKQMALVQKRIEALKAPASEKSVTQ